MSDTDAQAPPVVTMLVARQLDTIATGNGAFLMTFLRAVKRAGLEPRIVLAPQRSFGNRPWVKVHPAFQDIAEIVWPGSFRFKGACWSVSPIVWARFAVRLVQEALKRLSIDLGPLTRIHSPLGDELSAGEAARLARASDASPSALVIAEYSPLGPVLKQLKRQAPTGVFVHDLFSLRTEAFRARGETPDYTPMTFEKEVELINHADALFFASANERDHIAPSVRTQNLVWVRPETPVHVPKPAGGAPRGVFLGTRHAGNTDAMKHLIADIWPRVRETAPEAELWIAGSTCKELTSEEASAPGVKALGRVDDLATLGGGSSIGLAPTRLASGVSIKVAEYLMLGMPCIAYPVALEGFGAELDGLVDVVQDAAAFADLIVALLGDEASRTEMSQRGMAEAPLKLDNQPLVDALRKLATS
jgi:glycosyltransferase involved in cell wall biosynthesis